MGFLIGLFTVVMVVDCLVLMFLVLIQLPKKDAGAGLAFGGGATDALFGAGSGNVLTKITKYAATTFFALAVVLSLMQRTYHTRTTSVFEQKLQQSSPAPLIPATPGPPPSTPLTSPQTPAPKQAAVPGTNTLRIVPPPVEDTNLPIAIPLAPAPAPPPKQ
ncbi:MAG: preprotein translocase subunit SecG [Verrucomicrobiota bacterium]|jgi:preprotein translocase subunit SecG